MFIMIIPTDNYSLAFALMRKLIHKYQTDGILISNMETVCVSLASNVYKDKKLNPDWNKSNDSHVHYVTVWPGVSNVDMDINIQQLITMRIYRYIVKDWRNTPVEDITAALEAHTRRA